jgi:hypothetical protein
MRLRGVVLALLMAALPLACGGMTRADDAGDDAADGGWNDDGVASGGTGGTAVDGGVGGSAAITGGAPGTGGQSATGGDASAACSDHNDCTVVSAGCCGACEPVRAQDVQAVNWQWHQQNAGCDVACGACKEAPEVDRTSEYFVARCVEANCQLVDARDKYVECTDDDDCFLRDGSDCCEDCDGEGYIAVSSLAFVFETACPDIICATCDAVPPEGLSAQCNTETQRCEKVQEKK